MWPWAIIIQHCMFSRGGGGGDESALMRGCCVEIHFSSLFHSLPHHITLFTFHHFFEVNEPAGINTPDISLSFPLFLSSHTPPTSIFTCHHHHHHHHHHRHYLYHGHFVSISIPSSPRNYTLTGLGVLGYHTSDYRR